jgi:DNA-binding GntR family transcriptional regulator
MCPRQLIEGQAVTNLHVIRSIVSLKKQVVESLRAAIFEGRFKPGDRLVEREICELLDVSRTLLREALSQLEAEGIIRIIPHRGPIVADYTVEEARAIYELRAVLEEMAGRLFVERASEKERKELETAFAELKLAYKGRQQKSRLAVKSSFYAALCAGAHNPVLVEMLRLIHGRVTMLRAKTLAHPGRLSLSVAELKDIVQAVKRRDADAAAAACRRHVMNASAVATELMLDEDKSPAAPKRLRGARGK